MFKWRHILFKEQIRNKDKVIDSLLSQLSKRNHILLRNRWPAIKRGAVSPQTVKVKRQATTTITTSFTPTVRTTATTTTNPQIQTENKTTNEVFSKTPFGKTNIDKKEKEKETVNQTLQKT